MKTQILAGLAIALMITCYWQGCERGKSMSGITTVTKTVTQPGVHDTLIATRWRTVTNHDTLTVATHDTTTLHQIDSVLVAEKITTLTACVDTSTANDTLTMCYDYVTHRFAYNLRFAPIGIPVFEHRVPSYGLFFQGDVDLNEQVFVGVGAHGKILGLDLYGLVGFQRVPFEAIAHAGLRIDF